jgi:hypothetical protein
MCHRPRSFSLSLSLSLCVCVSISGVQIGLVIDSVDSIWPPPDAHNSISLSLSLSLCVCVSISGVQIGLVIDSVDSIWPPPDAHNSISLSLSRARAVLDSKIDVQMSRDRRLPPARCNSFSNCFLLTSSGHHGTLAAAVGTFPSALLAFSIIAKSRKQFCIIMLIQ